MKPPRTPTPWDALFMQMAHLASERSKDPDTQNGAVVVDEHHIVVATGFNGPPPGIDDTAIDWSRPNKYRWVIHAEDNAIYFATAARGLAGLRDCTLYVTGRPCSRCALQIRRAGITTVVFDPSKVIAMVDDGEWASSVEILGLHVSIQEFRI